MNSPSRRLPLTAHTGSTALSGRSAIFAAVFSGLLFLPAITAPANPADYGFYAAFVSGSLHNNIAQPYFESDPYSVYKPELTGSMRVTTDMIDLFPADPTRGYYLDSSHSNPVSFQLEGQQFSLLGDLIFDTYVGGSSFLTIYNEAFRLSFLFYTANFATDSAINLLSLPTLSGGYDMDIDLWTQSALGGGYAASDKIASVWHNNLAPAPDSIATTQLVNTQAVSVPVSVPDTLPLAGFLIPLLAVGFIHRRTRAGRHRHGLPAGALSSC